MDTPVATRLINRRRLLAHAGSASMMTPLLLGSAPGSGASAPAGTRSRIDFADPVQNLRAFMRLTADVDPARESTGWFGGHIFAVVDDKPLQMLCGVEGFGVMRVSPQKDGTYRVFNRELAFYKDPKTDEFIDEWTNPLTGEKCGVSPIHNRIVNATVAPILRQDFDGHMVERPFNPWTFLDDKDAEFFELHAVRRRSRTACESSGRSRGQRDLPANLPGRRSGEPRLELGAEHRDLDAHWPLAAVDADGTGAGPYHVPDGHRQARRGGRAAGTPRAPRHGSPGFLRAPAENGAGQMTLALPSVQERKPAPALGN